MFVSIDFLHSLTNWSCLFISYFLRLMVSFFTVWLPSIMRLGLLASVIDASSHKFKQKAVLKALVKKCGEKSETNENNEKSEHNLHIFRSTIVRRIKLLIVQFNLLINNIAQKGTENQYHVKAP
ncbi:MAG: hypothetical protein EXX96DRAFT_612575 [Benjaminiella poitrasii]|nr:MAG: hypothetical protein EXX96DRAFT_612575 [Benjaminiella poitrasii]